MTPERIAALRAVLCQHGLTYFAAGLTPGEAVALLDAAEEYQRDAAMTNREYAKAIAARVKAEADRDRLRAELDAIKADLRAAGALDE